MLARSYQQGFKIARHDLHAIGSYEKARTFSLSFKGVYMADIGTTILVASIREVGHAFHDNLTPVLSYVNTQLLQFPQMMPLPLEMRNQSEKKSG
jgi:hypothetical protein